MRVAAMGSATATGGFGQGGAVERHRSTAVPRTMDLLVGFDRCPPRKASGYGR